LEDFVFSTAATDELKLAYYRTARRGLQHRHDLCPRDPEPGQPVILTVQVGPDLTAEHVACYYTLDGSQPAGEHGVASNGQVLMLEPADVTWDTLIWNYLTKWQGTLPAQPEGTIVRYRIGAWAGESSEIFADWPDARATAETAASALSGMQSVADTPPGVSGLRHTFTYHVDKLGPPKWAWEAVIYHIFVDRFYPGDGRDWLQTSDLRGICGGTLWGIIEKLDYIIQLGANCLWLSPIFVSPSHHGYDTTDFYHVEPRLGGDDALYALVAEAHARDIRILLDLACNHVSDQHPIFLAARSDPSSPSRGWFTFDDSAIGYRTFFNVPSMPQVNVANPDARRWLINVAQYWLGEFDVDGYRLDHANGPGPDFWSDFWAACKTEKPDCFCLGEVVGAPDVQQLYVGRLDGCLDFHVADALRRTFALGQWTVAELDRFLTRHRAFFPEDFLMPTFLDNHDIDRFLYITGREKDRLRRAAAMQMHLSGPPIIYYGTEVGLGQAGSTKDGLGLHVSRVPMAWGVDQDQELLAYYRVAIQERRKNFRPG
jgi:cyclomaltodextrinase